MRCLDGLYDCAEEEAGAASESNREHPAKFDAEIQVDSSP